MAAFDIDAGNAVGEAVQIVRVSFPPDIGHFSPLRGRREWCEGEETTAVGLRWAETFEQSAGEHLRVADPQTSLERREVQNNRFACLLLSERKPLPLSDPQVRILVRSGADSTESRRGDGETPAFDTLEEPALLMSGGAMSHALSAAALRRGARH